MRNMSNRLRTVERATLTQLLRQQKEWLDSLTNEEFNTLITTTQSELDRDLFTLIRQAPLDVLMAAAANPIGHPERRM